MNGSILFPTEMAHGGPQFCLVPWHDVCVCVVVCLYVVPYPALFSKSGEHKPVLDFQARFLKGRKHTGNFGTPSIMCN